MKQVALSKIKCKKHIYIKSHERRQKTPFEKNSLPKGNLQFCPLKVTSLITCILQTIFFGKTINKFKNKKTNVVHKINCEDCDTLYIGPTGRNAKSRINEHY